MWEGYEAKYNHEAAGVEIDGLQSQIRGDRVGGMRKRAKQTLMKE